MYRVALLAVQNCMYSSISGLFDIFSVASYEAGRLSGRRDPLFTPVVVAPPHREISDFNGLPVRPASSFTPWERFDIVIAPVVFGNVEPLVSDQETLGWLERQGQEGACLCSVCAGAFLLAATGRLNGKRATTHWNLADDFARLFPEVILKREKMLLDEGDCITAGGVSAYLDLGLYLVSRFGSFELASSLSKILLIDPGRSLQTPYQTCSLNKDHGDVAIKAIQDWLEENLKRHVTVSALASRAGLGERTFMRRFKRLTGETPGGYLQQLRIETAKRLLVMTSEPVDEITFQTGYEDASSFRKLFKRHTGLSPSAYRKRFSYLH